MTDRKNQAASTSPLNSAIDEKLLAQTRIDLAASFRMAARLGLQEGICNHFSAVVPGRDDLFLVNPYGLAFEEVTASSLLVCDFDGKVILGEGRPEPTAFYIHAMIHRAVPRARAAFHTHMPNATALSMIEGQPLQWAGQSSLKFFGRTVVDENYNGLALDEKEGDRIAASVGTADIIFMRNHGVMVLGRSIAEAWDDLYYLERACEVQVKAMSTGKPLIKVSEDLARRTSEQMGQGGSESADAHLESVKRILLKKEPDYIT